MSLEFLIEGQNALALMLCSAYISLIEGKKVREQIIITSDRKSKCA